MPRKWTFRGFALRAALTLAVVTAGAGAPLQAQLTVGLTGGTVRYENVATTTSLSVNPDLLLTRERVLFDANVSASSATDGTRLIQGGTTFWAATPPFARHVQLTVLAQAQGTKPQGFAASSAVLGFGEIAVASPGKGIAAGVGAARGTLEGQPSVTALRTGARAWMAFGPASLAVAVQPTRLAGSWFTDFGGRVQSNHGAWILLGGVTVREGSGINTSTGVDGAAIWRPSGPVSFEMTGGRYLRDPYQALPAGWYLTAGVRLTLWTPSMRGLNSNVGLASLSTVGLAGQSATSLSTRSVPSVTKATNSSSSTGRGHRP